MKPPKPRKTSQRKSLRDKYRENNKKYKSIWDVVNTLNIMKPIYNDLIYKQGWEDCLYLLKRAVRDLEL